MNMIVAYRYRANYLLSINLSFIKGSKEKNKLLQLMNYQLIINS